MYVCDNFVTSMIRGTYELVISVSARLINLPMISNAISPRYVARIVNESYDYWQLIPVCENSRNLPTFPVLYIFA